MPTTTQILQHHFFRRFFDNDTLSIEGETETTVIRALALAAVPGLMVAFWLLPNYHSDPPYRSLWAVAADRYFFVLYGFAVMGIVTTFEWEMLFPDRADFLILLPLPLKSRDLFVAKGRALLAFLGMFLVAANIFPLILYSAESTHRKGSYAQTVAAHCSATFLAGIFAAFTMLAVEGLSIAIFPDRLQRYVSPLLQALSTTVLLLLLLLFPLVGAHLPPLLSGSSRLARYIPPLWFLGLYEHLSLGPFAPAGAASLAKIGLYGTAAATVLALAAYPAAWARQRRRALEGASQIRGRHTNPLFAVLHTALLRRPQQRAIFHFITQTVTRNSHYQVYLAIYAGAGLALALASILLIKPTADGNLILTLSTPGLHATLPLLLFWLVAGLRSAFAFPVDMRARWVFPINLPMAGEVFQRAAKAAKLWVLLCCVLLVAAILAVLLSFKWPWWNLAIQAIWGCGLALLLSGFFFLGRTQIPFTRPRLPGRSSLPIVLTLYAALFPALILIAVKTEMLTEGRTSTLLWTAATMIGMQLVLVFADRLAQQGIIGGFPEDETDEGPQTLGLSNT